MSSSVIRQIGSTLTGAEKMGTLFDIGHLMDLRRRDANIVDIRARSRAIFLGDDTVLCRSLGRYKMYVAASDVGFGAHLILDGFWELEITEFIIRHVTSGMTVLDLGANFGYYTLLMSELAGPSGQVLAFEPNPVASDFLSRSVSINGFGSIASVDRRAIWDRSGENLVFRIPSHEPKNARITFDEKWSGDFLETNVETIALDDLPISKVDFIKADIEGAEERLWSGMQKLLERSPDVIFLLEFAVGRCAEPRKILEDISRLFPLRYLASSGEIVPLSIEGALSRAEDWMLVLSRKI